MTEYVLRALAITGFGFGCLAAGAWAQRRSELRRERKRAGWDVRIEDYPHVYACPVPGCVSRIGCWEGEELARRVAQHEEWHRRQEWTVKADQARADAIAWEREMGEP